MSTAAPVDSVSAVHRVRLVCIDVDGTLVGSGGRVHPSVWPAAEALRLRSVRVAVCSGRPGFGLARAYALRLDARGWHSFQNGASVVDFAAQRSRSVPLPLDAVEWLIAHARRTGRMLELYTDFDYAIESHGDRARAHAALLGVPFHPKSFDRLAGPIVRAQWMVRHDEVAAILDEPRPALELAASTSPVMPEVTFLNLTPPGVTKATAVRAIAEAYGISLEEIMFVGDGNNDAPAMRIVGLPVAMAHSDVSAVEAAAIRVGDVDDGGLTEALELALQRA